MPGASRPAQPLEDVTFEMPADALPPSNLLKGRLTLLDTSAIRYSLLRDDEGDIVYEQSMSRGSASPSSSEYVHAFYSNQDCLIFHMVRFSR